MLKDPGTRLSWDIDKNFVLTYPIPIQVSRKQSIIDEINKQVTKVLEEKKKPKPIFSSFMVSVQRSRSIDKLDIDENLKTTLENLLSKVDRLSQSGGSPIPDGLLANHLEAWDLVERKGLSQSGAAERMGLSQGRISQLLREYREITDRK